ncbi:hypothetical protein V5799_011087 [Amblyomma americanum]|uniref:Uncharacterized protein n=1 Tax=Amblyomma americanum TaxID=6943 RepID=A0AAQ4EIW2_AMBAM
MEFARHLVGALSLFLVLSGVLASSQTPTQTPSQTTAQTTAHLVTVVLDSLARHDDGHSHPARLDRVVNELVFAGNATPSLRGMVAGSSYRSPLELGLMAAAAAGAVGLLLPFLLPAQWAVPSRSSETQPYHQVPLQDRGGLLGGRGGLAGLSEFVMTRVDKGLEKFPSIPSLDPQECMKRSVCEAHNQPNKYGLIGLLLQLLYPPYSAPDEPTTVVSKYQLAARYGRQEDADCSRQYDGCIVSPLEMIQTIVGYFLR